MKNMYLRRVDLLAGSVGKSSNAWRMVPVLLAIFFLHAFVGLAQTTKAVTGKVTTAGSDVGLPGVNVVVKGTSNGTVTNGSGEFTLQVPEDAVLVVSFVGFKTQEVKVGGRSQVNVNLAEDDELLSEVVITGYGEVRKSEVTGAQTTIGTEAIEKTVNTTIEQAIQGRAAGVYVTQNTGAPGGGISVNIRGINSIGGTNEPLYVIDGVQIPGSVSPSGSNPLSTLNPSDIESMEILQGPSATALYGSRATNGVVLITTKRGKSGEVRVNYSYLHSIQTAPERLEVMNLRQYAQMDNEYKAIAGGNVREDFLDPSLLGDGTDWQGELFQSAPMNKHQVSVSGGSEKTTYYLSGEYLEQAGIALGSGFDRYSVRLNLDNQAKKWLTIKGNFSYAQTNESLSTTQSDIITRAIQLAPHIPVRNLDGTYGGGIVTATSTGEQFSPPNPIGLANLTQNDFTRRQLLGGLTVGAEIMEGLDFSTSVNGRVEFANGTYFLPTYKFGYQQNTVAVLNNTDNLNTYWNWSQMLQYRKQFGKHSINVMATHESQESFWRRLYGERRGFQTNDVIDLEAGDILTSVASGGHGDWAMESYLGRVIYNFGDRYILTGAIRADGSVNFGPENRWGYFPSLSAAWRVSEEEFFNVGFVNDLRLRYEIGLTGNQGGSGAIYGTLAPGPTPWGTGFIANRYPNPNFQWEETKTSNFGINLGMFENRVQLEADYYIKDTDNLILQSSLPWYMGTNGNGAIQAPTVNIGSLQNKGWSVTLNTVNIDNGSFVWQSNFNISHFKTEVKSLTSETSQIDKVNWWLNNWTQRTVVGQAPWLFYGYIEEGIFQSREELENSALPADNNGVEFPIAENSIWVGDVKYKDINGDGIITGEDQTFIGNPYPKYYAGFTNSFSYKGFDLSVLITSTYGNDIYNYLRNENTNPNNINLGRNLFVGAFDYAKVEVDAEGNPYLLNPNTTVARMSGGNKNNNFQRHTDKYVEDGSFVRLKNVTLTYRLPSTVLEKLKYIKGANIGVSAQNVYTLTGYSGYDPEVGSYVGANASAGNAAIGVDYGRYPLTPVYSFNVGIDF
ncbi:TonB-linked SusC/RagA family outer membrane protein [Pontibacter ummariensis]|uniref:TonB-linked outer membrane protein, SusC/RagA family n=2 Tax=Pontibacter ummariensis TaxID=1610492 RepID=A0A239H719_9BACT|nr:TonB-linked SusC/RagA family outer membrane protein [Pontibacter ummariensis]SNS77209.1 TonB-linked outer membrane protein, SusC/RagA family [Pontibacter ummariensis]